jgi:pyridoxine/pyridoxamine 5'-phosphate oxidase
MACPSLSVLKEQGTRFFFAKMIKIPVKVIPVSASVFDRLAIISEKQRDAVLATDDNGQPYASLITFTLTPDRRSLIFATPRNSTKYRNIRKNHRVSVLIDNRSNTDRSYMLAEAVTVQGIARTVRKEKSGMTFAGCSSGNIQNLGALYGRKVR